MTRAGIVTLVGRPNAGKSTLMNRLVAEHVAIVSDKPQTTRNLLVGILSEERGQMVFYDTPGVHRPLHKLNQRMMQWAQDALRSADVICLLVDAALPFGRGDAFLLDLIARSPTPRVLALNKIDLVRKDRLLPLMDRYAKGADFEDIVPISALDGDGCDELLDCLWRLLPEGPPLYDTELFTTHPERFLAAERIREKLLEQLEDELPFTTAVLIDQWDESGPVLAIYASILVERPSQKSIVIGQRGRRIKAIGTAARLDLEEFFGRRIYLDLHVRVEARWRENRRVLADLDAQVRSS